MQTKERSCPLGCQAASKYLYRPKNSPGPVVRCNNCELVYVSPIENVDALIFHGPEQESEDENLQNELDLSKTADCWEIEILLQKEDEREAIEQNAMGHLSRIEGYVESPGKLLDFGSGTGYFLNTASKIGWDVVGLEPLPGHAAYARREFNIEIVNNTLQEDTFPQDFFDLITTFQVFEHIPDPSGDLDKLYKFLKPHGHILIEVPNIDNWGVRLLGARHRHFVQDHITFFAKDTLSKFLENHGFKILAIYYPERLMSIRHLVSFWISRYLPSSLTRFMELAAKRFGLWDRIIGIKIGDIVAVLATKVA